MHGAFGSVVISSWWRWLDMRFKSSSRTKIKDRCFRPSPGTSPPEVVWSSIRESPAGEEWRGWIPEHSRHCLEHPGFGAVKAWNDAVHNATTGLTTYQTHYRMAASGQRFSASSTIRFTARESLAAMLDDVGLEVDEWLGDWRGGAYEPRSPEIIPIATALTWLSRSQANRWES
jgi:hypothetical protein